MEGIPLSLPCTTSISSGFCYKPLQCSSTRLQYQPILRWKTRLSLRIKSPSATDSSPPSTTTETTESATTADVSPAASGSEFETSTSSNAKKASSSSVLDKELTSAVRKTAATFAPRASTKTKNPAVPGSTLYTVFEVQGYLSMALGGLLSFNLVFPSSEPDIWRLMGMWSVWMFTIPSLRARDCSNKEKDALNYLFLVVPLINVLLPIYWKSFAAVWSADVVAFFLMYAWKLDWLSLDRKDDS